MAAATTGIRRSAVSASNVIAALSTEPIERADVDAVKALADAEQEDADHDERDQYGKRDADLDHQRHALGSSCRQHQAVFQRHEADHLAHRVAPGHFVLKG